MKLIPGERIRYYLPTLLVAVTVIAAWEIVVIAFDIQQFLLPKPSAIFSEFMTQVNLWLTPGRKFTALRRQRRDILGGAWRLCHRLRRRDRPGVDHITLDPSSAKPPCPSPSPPILCPSSLSRPS